MKCKACYEEAVGTSQINTDQINYPWLKEGERGATNGTALFELEQQLRRTSGEKCASERQTLLGWRKEPMCRKSYYSFCLSSLMLALCFSPSPQAPFTPFITEMMYQNLCHLIDPASVEEKDASSIHYLMLPQVRLGKCSNNGFMIRVVLSFLFLFIEQIKKKLDFCKFCRQTSKLSDFCKQLLN